MTLQENISLSLKVEMLFEPISKINYLVEHLELIDRAGMDKVLEQLGESMYSFFSDIPLNLYGSIQFQLYFNKLKEGLLMMQMEWINFEDDERAFQKAWYKFMNAWLLYYTYIKAFYEDDRTFYLSLN